MIYSFQSKLVKRILTMADTMAIQCLCDGYLHHKSIALKREWHTYGTHSYNRITHINEIINNIARIGYFWNHSQNTNFSRSLCTGPI